MRSLLRYMSSTHMRERNTWRLCVERAAQAGFDGVELFGWGFADEELMRPERLYALAACARRAGVRLSAHPWMEWAGMPAESLRARCKKLAEDCARLTVRELNVHMAFYTDRSGGLTPLFDAFDPLMPFLQAQGMVLLFENVPGHGVRELGSETADFEALFAHYTPDVPVGMTIDNGHAHIMGITRALALRFGARWLYTHINDNNGVQDQHVAPGLGSADWNELADVAKQAGYYGPLMMEYAFDMLASGMPLIEHAFAAHGFWVKPLF